LDYPLGIKTLSSSHAASEYKFWTIQEFNTPPLTDGRKKYYLYAKVGKASNTGVFYLSETAIAMEGVAGYYHLLMGILNSEFEGERSYVSLYGFTEILPGQITTEKVVSSDGHNYIDFLNNAFRIGNEKQYLAWNVVSGLLEIMNANIVANGKFSTKDPSEGFRLDFEGSKLDVYSLSNSYSVGGVEGAIVGYPVNDSGMAQLAPTTVFRSKYAQNTLIATGAQMAMSNQDNTRQVIIDWNGLRTSTKNFLILVLKGLPQMDNPIGILSEGQLYRDSNNILKITP
jgi:hypothetical protein